MTKTPRCLICQNPALRLFVDENLNKGMSNAGISAALDAIGGKLDPEVTGRHKRGHWSPPVNPDAPKATKKDLAILVRDKVYTAVEEKDPDLLLIMGKELAPMIGKGLQAEAIIDKRAAVAAKGALGAGILMLVERLDRMTTLQLEDGRTIEGTAIDVTPLTAEDIEVTE